MAASNVDLGEIQSTNRSNVRTVVVVGIVASLLAVSLPGLLPSLRDNGTVLSVGIGAGGRVTAVDDVSARGGLRVGDRVEPHMTLGQWERLLMFVPIPIGDALPLTVTRDGRTIHIAIKADRATGWPSYWVYFIKTFSQAIYLLVAATLVLLRPSRLTWSFFALSVGYGAEVTQPWFWQSSPTSIAMLWWLNNWNGIVYTPGALFIFAASFPGRTSNAFWHFIDSAGIPVNIALTAWNGAFFAAIVAGSVAAFLFLSLPFWPIATIAGLLLVVSAYWSSNADQRQRLKWVIFAFVASYIERSFTTLHDFQGGGAWPTSWSSAGFPPDVLAILNLLVPVAVAYAVLKHRVLDINFVLSRALVYGVITSLIVGAFAVIDLVLAKALEQRQLAFALEFIVAIAFGFGLNGIHKRVDAVIDRVLFRSRHFAERAIERLAAGLPHVTTARAVNETMAIEPTRALNLTSSAVFVKDESGGFARRAAVAWLDGSSTEIGADDPLVINLQGEFGTMRVSEVRQDTVIFPTGEFAPVIAIPMFVRHQLLGFALYGAHASGEDIDPDERQLLERLAHAAAVTYDHIDSDSVRNKLRDVTLELDLMKAASHA